MNVVEKASRPCPSRSVSHVVIPDPRWRLFETLTWMHREQWRTCQQLNLRAGLQSRVSQMSDRESAPYSCMSSRIKTWSVVALVDTTRKEANQTKGKCPARRLGISPMSWANESIRTWLMTAKQCSVLTINSNMIPHSPPVLSGSFQS